VCSGTRQSGSFPRVRLALYTWRYSLARNRMVTDKCIATGLPLRVAGRYFHWRRASTAACCRSGGPETAFAAVTRPFTSITASTCTSPSTCWLFASNGYPGKTADTQIGVVDVAADCVFGCPLVVTGGEAKVTSPGNVARLAVPSCDTDWDTTAEAGGWLTAAVPLLRAGLELLRRYNALPAARTSKTAATAPIRIPLVFLVEAWSGSVVFSLARAWPRVNAGGLPVSLPCAVGDVACFCTAATFGVGTACHDFSAAVLAIRLAGHEARGLGAAARDSGSTRSTVLFGVPEGWPLVCISAGKDVCVRIPPRVEPPVIG